MRWVRLTLLALLLTAATPVSAFPQETSPAEPPPSPMSTDRPDLTDSTDIVGRGIWQIETGWSFDAARDHDLSVHTTTAPLALLRVGLADNVEMRISSDGMLSDAVTRAGTHEPRLRHTGRSDVEFGVKWRLLGRPFGALFAVEPVVSIPAGSIGISSGSVDPLVKLIVDRDLFAQFAMSSNVVFASTRDDDGRHRQVAASVSVARPLFSHWSGFAELYSASGMHEGSASSWTSDVGAIRPLGHRCQLDVSVGRGHTDTTADWFVGAGFSLRGSFGR